MDIKAVKNLIDAASDTAASTAKLIDGDHPLAAKAREHITEAREHLRLAYIDANEALDSDAKPDPEVLPLDLAWAIRVNNPDVITEWHGLKNLPMELATSVGGVTKREILDHCPVHSISERVDTCGYVTWLWAKKQGLI